MGPLILLILSLLAHASGYGIDANDISYYDGVPTFLVDNTHYGYHGAIKENETDVELTPPIKVTGADVCSYHMVHKNHADVPFKILMTMSGEAVIRATRMLNCEKRRNYKFDIVAVACSGETSKNMSVHVNVLDVNEFPPVFAEQLYETTVEEKRLYEEIIRVEATDSDCSPKYGDVCRYEILQSTELLPFSIDREGVIRNTEPLEYANSPNYMFSVVAYDCDMKPSTPVMVNIKLVRPCNQGWSGIPERIDFSPMSRPQILLPNAAFEICDEFCDVIQMNATLSLSNSHIGKGCDRDTYSVSAKRKICGARDEAIELLPSTNMHTDKGKNADEVFEFDGNTSAVAIPNDILDHGLSSRFTFSTWMKHKPTPGLDKHAKEHILCSADDHMMNRHHYAWFVRNCRLILLLRRDFSRGDLNIFRPAEWRWKIPQVCDDKWHHYAVSVDYPSISLHIDGIMFQNENKNPEVIDDWPLHPTKDINTTLTVGACWQSSENTMKHHLRGYLAGLTVLLHKTEQDLVLSCMNECNEGLEMPDMKYLEVGMRVIRNFGHTEVIVDGNSVKNLTKLLTNIAYSNQREFPTTGRRNVVLKTYVECENGNTLDIPIADTYVMVLPTQRLDIHVNGTDNLSRDYKHFKEGLRIFPDVQLTFIHRKNSHEKVLNTLEEKLDSCVVSVYPSLNLDHESIILPDHVLRNSKIIGKVAKDGAILTGVDEIKGYEKILREIAYKNEKPAYYLNRVFKLICSEMNDRYESNEYVQTLTMVHPHTTTTTSEDYDVADAVTVSRLSRHIPPVPAHHLISHHNIETPPHSYVARYIADSIGQHNRDITSGGSNAVTIVVIMCCAFLMLMGILGLVRTRAIRLQRRAQDELQDAEMAWDDSGLNITENPLEKGGLSVIDGKMGTGDEEEHTGEYSSDDDDDNSNGNDDDLDSSSDDEGDGPKPNGNGLIKVRTELEWDNTAL